MSSHTGRWVLVFSSIAALGFSAVEPALASSGNVDRLLPSDEAIRLALTRAGAAKDALEPHLRKVDTALRTALARLEADGLDEKIATPADVEMAVRPPVRARGDGSVLVKIRATSLGAADLRRLRGAGFRETFVGPEFGFAEGWLPVFRIEAVARLAFVLGVGPVYAPLANTGMHQTEGDAILQADQARTMFGVSGSGVKVGVISDSVDGLASAVAAGDLPNTVQVLQAGTGAGEGTAMLEIVHDLAPGAPLAFYGPSTSGDMITGIQQLAAAGARVIVDDLTFFDQPHFEAGPIAQAVNAAAAAGVVYATSAGNFGAGTSTDRGHYEAQYVDGGSLGSLASVHDFGGGTTVQHITIFPGATGRIFMQWSDPFGASSNDYDLYVIDAVGTIVAKSDNPQDGDDDPLESVSIPNPGGSSVTLRVIVNKFSGVDRRVELYYASGITDIEFATAAGSIAGHANASGAITVASINAGDPGHDDLADYSSRGPCDVISAAGTSADKPDITAIDGVTVSGAAGFPSPFFGTSAAAPHIAGIAALMLEEHPTLTASTLKAALQATAADLGAGGFDFGFGAGRADALAAVGAVQPTGAPPVLDTFDADLQGDHLVTAFTGTDADGDVTFIRVTLRDGASATLADSGLVAFDLSGQTAFMSQTSFTGLSSFPTALTATLQLADDGGNLGSPLVSDFSVAAPGGPTITLARYNRTKKVLAVTGTGFTGALAVEINGKLFSSNVRVNAARTRVKLLKARRGKVGLRHGPNRIRVLSSGAHSNILILNLP